MEHLVPHRDGSFDFKIVESCSLPLTGQWVVDWIITDLAVIDVEEEGLRVVEMAPDVDIDFVQACTGVQLLT